LTIMSGEMIAGSRDDPHRDRLLLCDLAEYAL
jgi:hypothetical protein